MGGFSGYIVGEVAGATGWEMAGYIAGGALIGGASGGAALGVSAAGGGAMLAGAAAGAVSGGGFTALNGGSGSEILQGAAFGAIAGFVGGGVGSAIGGGWGALAGGASSNLTSQLLYNGGDFSQVNFGSVGLSGAISFGMYHGMSYAEWRINYKETSNMKYSGFSKMNADYQRSRFWRREFGGIVHSDGSVTRLGWDRSRHYGVDIDGIEFENDDIFYHTHWDKAGRTVAVDINGNDITRLKDYRFEAVYDSEGRVWPRNVTTAKYHGDFDYLDIRTLVLYRNGYSFAYGGANTYQVASHDPFLRFFLFPFFK